MKPCDNTELFETPISTHWFDENGILYGLSKNAKSTIEHYQELIDLYKKLTKNGNKLCLLADSRNSMPMATEVTEYVLGEYPKYLKAIAILSGTPLGGIQVNTFLKLTFSSFPIMKFSCEEEAREWLKEYL